MIRINIDECNIQNINCNMCCEEKPKDSETVIISVINDLDTQAVLFDLMPTSLQTGANIRIIEDGVMVVLAWEIKYLGSNMLTISVPNTGLFWTVPKDCGCSDKITLEPLDDDKKSQQYFTMENIPGVQDLVYLKSMGNVYVGTTQMPVQPNTDLIVFKEGTGTFKAGFSIQDAGIGVGTGHKKK